MSDENKIVLEFDDNEEIECDIIGVFEALDKEYIALIPETNKEEVYIYGYKEMGEEFELMDIEDDDEFQQVVEVFDEIMASNGEC